MTGQIFKYTGSKVIIRPDEFFQGRKDVVCENSRHLYNIGDRVEFDIVIKNNRAYAENIKPLT